MKHYIIVKFQPHVTDREGLTQEVSALFQGALQIKGVKAVSTRAAILFSEKRYDLMICVEMEKEALAAFDQSDVHRLWKERFAQNIAHKVIFDCE